MKNYKIALFGATGRVGQLVTRNLLSKGVQVNAIGRNVDKLKELQDTGAKTFKASFKDTDVLEKALENSDIVVTMVPSDHLADDFFQTQMEAVNAQINAIKTSSVPNVLNLSSAGAHLPEGNGILKGLHQMENKLNALHGVKVAHMRPGYFMENAFYSIPLMKMKKINGLPAKGTHAFPMVAIEDVAKTIVEKLVNFDSLSDGEIVPVLGPKDYTLLEFTQVLGSAIGQPGIPYVEFTNEDMKGGMLQGNAGSESFIDSYIELMRSFESGSLNLALRNADNTTEMKGEVFAETIFAPVFKTVMKVESN